MAWSQNCHMYEIQLSSINHLLWENVMKLKLTLAALLIAPLALTACSKKEEAPAAEQTQTAAPADEKVTPEQQAAIDAIDKPVMDEKNTDLTAEEANAPAEVATPADEKDAAAISAIK